MDRAPAEDTGEFLARDVESEASTQRNLRAAGAACANVRRLEAALDAFDRVGDLRLIRPVRRRRVLVVDDESLVLESLGPLLRGAGYFVDTAETTAAARLLVKGADYDVLLVDAALSGSESGLELAEELSRPDDEGRCAVGKVVIMSGWTHLESRLRMVAVQIGAEFVTKSGDPNPILAAVGRAAS